MQKMLYLTFTAWKIMRSDANTCIYTTQRIYFQKHYELPLQYL